MGVIGEILNPLNHPRWNELVAATPSASFFHTENWARVLAESYGYVPRYFAVPENGGLRALLPVMEIRSFLTGRRGVSLPFSDFGDGFAREEDEYRELAEQAIGFGRSAGWTRFEVRGGKSPWTEAEHFLEYYGHRLRLGRDENDIVASFRTNTRRNINKAIKSGVRVSFSNSREALEAFYELNLHTRREHGIPPQPKKFFQKIGEHILKKDLGTVVLASHEGECVAGAVFFHFGSTVIYKYGASIDTGKRLRANNLVMWEAIRAYNARNFATLLFGRTEYENAGLREYKTGYGTEEEIIPYFRYDLRRNCPAAKQPRSAMGVDKAYRFVPIPVSRLVGTVLYKHIG